MPGAGGGNENKREIVENTRETAILKLDTRGSKRLQNLFSKDNKQTSLTGKLYEQIQQRHHLQKRFETFPESLVGLTNGGLCLYKASL